MQKTLNYLDHPITSNYHHGLDSEGRHDQATFNLIALIDSWIHWGRNPSPPHLPDREDYDALFRRAHESINMLPELREMLESMEPIHPHTHITDHRILEGTPLSIDYDALIKHMNSMAGMASLRMCVLNCRKD